MSSKLIKGFKISGIAFSAVVFVSLSIIIYFYRVEPLWIDAELRDFSYYILSLIHI